MVSSPSLILLAADDADTAEPVAETLRRDGQIPLVGTTRARALSTLANQTPQLAVVWLQLPDAPTAFDLIRTARGHDNPLISHVPLIVVDPVASELNCLQAFHHGADDYIDAVCSTLQLRARIDALLRRSHPTPQHAGITLGHLKIDSETLTATVAGVALSLSRKEFALLHELASQPGRVFTKAELLHSVWHYPPHAHTRTVDSHASRLRRKLLTAVAPTRLDNVWGVGYRLVGTEADQRAA
jgi:DNA-binding response OmpR family regulator